MRREYDVFVGQYGIAATEDADDIRTRNRFVICFACERYFGTQWRRERSSGIGRVQRPGVACPR